MIQQILPILLLLSPPSETFEIEANSLELIQTEHKALFQGQVRAIKGDFKIECDQMTALYSPEGEILFLELEGHLKAIQGDYLLTASNARYDAKIDQLILLGHPQIRRGEDLLQGEQIYYWPKTKKLQVMNAKGKIRSKALDQLGQSIPQLIPSNSK